MASHENNGSRNTAADTGEAIRSPSSRTRSADEAVTLSLACELDLQRAKTAGMLASVKTRTAEIADVLARAEHMAEAALRPLQVWDEAQTILDGGSDSRIEKENDSQLAWALAEASGICEMFLQNATGGRESSDNVIQRIDCLLAALDADDRRVFSLTGTGWLREKLQRLVQCSRSVHHIRKRRSVILCTEGDRNVPISSG